MNHQAAFESRLAYLMAAVETSDDAVISLDLVGRITTWNRGAQRLFGLSESLVKGSRLAQHVGDRDAGGFARSLGLAVSGTSVERLDVSVRRRDGSTVATQLTATPVRAGDGHVVGLSVVLRDVAEQVLAQSTLADNAQRVAQSEALAHVGSWAWDAGSGAVQWSEEQHRIHGLSPLDFDGTLEGQLQRVHPLDRARFARAVREAADGGAVLDQEIRILRPDQSVRWVDVRASRADDPARAAGEALGLRGIYHDITDRHESAEVLQEANERLTRLALYDRLTGLPNRALLIDRLGQSLSRGRQIGARVDLMYIGIDDFKTINDSVGHSAGDQVLIALAPLLGQAVRNVGLAHRPPGRMLARLGGDEFGIVLDDGDPRAMAAAIHDLLRQPLHLPDDQVFINVSIGNAHAEPARGDATPEMVLTEGNIAMREAKRAGKARFVTFEPRMHEAARRRHVLGHELHQALSEGQFLVHYQPVVELASGEVIGAEALVRWQHPTRGLVSPDAFIARSEENGVIVPLGAWVLKEACAEAMSWQKSTGRPLSIAVNVSGRQLREPDFVETVQAALSSSGLPASLLCLEMTESILMERDEAGLAMLTTLRQQGVHLAIDDFGTGYSSLAALRRLPVDQLKIDQSFVAGLPEDEDAATIAWAIVHLGHALGLQVLAEGVETPAQRLELLRFGGDHAQGFLFGGGVSGSELADAVSRSNNPSVPFPRGAERPSDVRR